MIMSITHFWRFFILRKTFRAYPSSCLACNGLAGAEVTRKQNGWVGLGCGR
jgi:hypothetical protein